MVACNQALLHEAVLWAAQLHAGQDRDGDPAVPYLSHPLEVMNILRLGGVKNYDTLTAAVLHDVVEETETAFKDIEMRFGKTTAALVAELTRTEPTETEVQGLTAKQKYDLRSELLLDDVRRMSRAAQSVKLADRLSNLRAALVVRKGEKLDRYLVQSRKILDIIARDTAPKIWDEINGHLTETNQP